MGFFENRELSKMKKKWDTISKNYNEKLGLFPVDIPFDRLKDIHFLPPKLINSNNEYLFYSFNEKILRVNQDDKNQIYILSSKKISFYSGTENNSCFFNGALVFVYGGTWFEPALLNIVSIDGKKQTSLDVFSRKTYYGRLDFPRLVDNVLTIEAKDNKIVLIVRRFEEESGPSTIPTPYFRYKMTIEENENGEYVIHRCREKKQCISLEQMGLIVCETARTRAEDFLRYCNGEKYPINPTALQVYSFIYNFYFISRTLSKSYDIEDVHKIMDMAFDSFLNMSASFFSEDELNEIKTESELKFFDLEEIMFGWGSENFGNLSVEVARKFLEDTVDSRNHLDADIITATAVEMTSWITGNDFLIEQYKLG